MRKEKEDLICKFVEQNEKLFIYGAGALGKQTAEYLSSRFIPFDGFVVSDNQKIRSRTVDNHQVFHLNEIADSVKLPATGIILALDKRNHECALHHISSYGFTNILDFFQIPSREDAGHCVICERETRFVAYGEWLRDHYMCISCKSIPRQRAIVSTLNHFCPEWHKMQIHESSPVFDGTASSYISRKTNESSGKYSYSHYFKDVEPGGKHNGIRCENIEDMTFDNETFDLFVTQDVFEHILNPDKAFKEIRRVLKPGGKHIFTMPWYPENQHSVFRCISDADGGVITLKPPIYHGNPVDDNGSIVTVDWGLDFADYIYRSCGMTTMVYIHENGHLGLAGEHLQVFICAKLE